MVTLMLMANVTEMQDNDEEVDLMHPATCLQPT